MCIVCVIFQRSSYDIRNHAIRSQIEISFKSFQTAGQTMDDFFQITLLTALKRTKHSFQIQKKKVTHDRIIIIFGNGNKKDDYFHGGDLQLLKSF